MDGWMGGWVDGWVGGWVGGQAGGRAGGRMVEEWRVASFPNPFLFMHVKEPPSVQD